MMPFNFTRFFISAFLYLLICVASILLINPQSFINFVGPAAALFSGLLIVWGITSLIAVLVVSPVLAVILNYYFHLDANVAVMSIAVLAILLQGIWTKQLVFGVIHDKKWLTSRKYLLLFLFRIGPVASLVSASSVLVISMLDNQIIEGTYFYTFINTWAASMLVAVFITPLLLMAKNAEHFPLTKRLFVSFTSILGGVGIFLLLKTSQFEQQQYREALFNQSKVEIKRLVLDEIDDVVNEAKSLSALFKAKDNVSLTEFNLFSESIFKKDSSVRALEWAPIVLASQKEAFEYKGSQLLQYNFQINERSPNGQIGRATLRDQYAPLYYIYPQQGNQAALGLDTFSNPKHILSMQQVVDSESVIASTPITLIQDEFAYPGILFTQAVFSPLDKNHINEYVEPNKLSVINKGELLGFVTAVAQFDRFFERIAENKSSEVKFFIQDVSSHKPFTLFGKALATSNRHVSSFTVSVFSKTWQIDIAEKQPWFSQSKTWQAWAVLIGGTFGAVLFQMLILMMAAYSSELGQQVNSKTRALILAKESSDQKSLAKSQFLQTLNAELRVPLLALKSFVEKLKEKGVNNKELAGISHAGSNVALLLDTMMDLSNIESGKVRAKADCFDFHGFLQRTESVLKASNTLSGKSILFLIDESVPHYINSDELYIQKLLNALIESAHYVLKADMLRLSIKLHKHKLEEASLFFTLSPQNSTITPLDIGLLNQQRKEQLVADSTALAMAIKYSQLLKGDTNLGALSSGAGVLNASIRVVVSSNEQQEAQQALTFDLVP